MFKQKSNKFGSAFMFSFIIYYVTLLLFQKKKSDILIVK